MRSSWLNRAARGGIMDFSARGWGRVAVWTVVGTLTCIAVALGADIYFNFHTYDDDMRFRAIITDIGLPMVIAPPLLLFLTIKLRELAIAHYELARLASMDSLTSLLNRGAFTALVEGYLAEIRTEEAEKRGALLLIDADNFKAVNDSFGHDRGDEALKLIAASIRGLMRATDLVGRLGGEEFGVFLPGSSAMHAELVAERIRHAVSEAPFTPDGKSRRLSVSVGGAAFSRRLDFLELFRIADQQLYAAKRQGRDRVCVVPVEPEPPQPVPMAS